jgi:hypothetical protein
MAGKPFNPFEDDDSMEFVPEPGSPEEPPRANPIANHATQIKAQPTARTGPNRHLKLDFAELQEAGTDTRGATKIGADKLGADEFLSGIKRKDFDTALDKAKASQNAPARAPVQEARVIRRVRTPLYLLMLGIVLFVGALVGGYYGYKRYVEQQAIEGAKASEALQRVH